MTTDARKHAILVVDDEPEILRSLRGLLRREFDVHTAQSGAEALDVLRQHAIQVVLTDQRMPELTGVELLSRVRGEWPDAIRIVFTGYSDIKAVIDAINEGDIYRYITKPWDPDELLSLLRQACAHQDEIAARRRLLADLRGFQTQCLGFTAGLRDGRLGTLTPDGRMQAAQVEEAARALQGALGEAPAAPAPSETLGEAQP